MGIVPPAAAVAVLALLAACCLLLLRGRYVELSLVGGTVDRPRVHGRAVAALATRCLRFVSRRCRFSSLRSSSSATQLSRKSPSGARHVGLRRDCRPVLEPLSLAAQSGRRDPAQAVASPPRAPPGAGLGDPARTHCRSVVTDRSDARATASSEASLSSPGTHHEAITEVVLAVDV